MKQNNGQKNKLGYNQPKPDIKIQKRDQVNKNKKPNCEGASFFVFHFNSITLQN